MQNSVWFIGLSEHMNLTCGMATLRAGVIPVQTKAEPDWMPRQMGGSPDKFRYLFSEGGVAIVEGVGSVVSAAGNPRPFRRHPLKQYGVWGMVIGSAERCMGRASKSKLG